MNSKKIPLILIAVAFFIAVICSCYILFNVTKIETQYSVSDQVDCQEIQEKLDELKGRNLLFFNKEEVYEIMKEYPTCKVKSVEKKFPNYVEVVIIERLPVYKMVSDQTIYLLDEEGVVIKEGQGDVADRDLIDLGFEGVNVMEPLQIGKQIKTDRQEMFNSSLEMSKAANLTDSIKQMTIKYLSAGEVRDVVFSTYTGVDIVITKADINGEAKINKAIESYDNCDVDFIKSYNQILIVEQDDGQIKPIWTNT
ncbi:MAG: FtsQ-type POTRA domain-containing protein [Clostridia bacterium]|nr:FtsQ-type POTRA domain-containing protein [Clostridia bacterium]